MTVMRTIRSSTSFLIAITVIGSVTVSLAQIPLPTAPRRPALQLGAAWYPEQWPESRWDADLQLMQDAHVTFVRMGEFAWSTMEPHENNYQFDWLERAIRAAERHHIAVVLGTPTAAPPAWLTEKYPETLRTKEDGRKEEHGGRQQFDWSNAKYRELARDIAGRMAQHFGHDPNVVAWQVDNEYNEESYGPETKRQFDGWLKSKYQSLDNLNARWTTAYWSETYQNWDQIPIEEQTGNPGLLLNWKEFVSDTWRNYQRNQIEAIRAYADPRQIITTNMMGFFDKYDHYTVAQDLDFASWDNYVGTGQIDLVKNGAAHDLMRGLLRRNFWVMETQPGYVDWAPNNNSLNKGEVRAMAWNAVGHGAEAVEYWQWRSALNGQEQYHGTLVGPDGTPVPLYSEVQQIGAEFQKAATALADTSVISQVAVLQDYPSRWAINWQRHNQAFDPKLNLLSYYGPLHALVRSVDIVQDTVSLGKYKLVVAPALNVLTAEAAKNLEAYVRAGGHLVLGARSAMKDDDNSLWYQRQPGPLVDLLGARVEQYYALNTPAPLVGQWGKSRATLWAEQIGILSPDTKTLMRYGKSNGWLDDQPAAVTRRIGKGSITYIGADMDDAGMKQATLWMLEESGVAPVMQYLPASVDVAIRTGEGKRVLIITNYGDDTVSIHLPTPMDDVLHGGKVTDISLVQYGVVVLE